MNEITIRMSDDSSYSIRPQPNSNIAEITSSRDRIFDTMYIPYEDIRDFLKMIAEFADSNFIRY